MKKINWFNTRIIIDGKVYLLASDVRKAFKFKNIDELKAENSSIVKSISGLPQLVTEDDFNNILLGRPEIADELGHIEMTRVETLRTNTESIKSVYPLKLLFAGEMFKFEAQNRGYNTVEEYIDKIDFPKEIQQEKTKLISSNDLTVSIEESREKLKTLIDYSVLEKYELDLKQYIHIKKCKPYLETFIVGRGIFFSVYDSDYAFDSLRVENGDLIIPTYDDYADKYEDHNYGHNSDMRDYRKCGTLESLIYVLNKEYIEDAGVDLMKCEAPGISFYISQTEVIKLFCPNIYRDVLLIDGDMDFVYSKAITKDITQL